jgi:enoyl-CoA hydratase
MKDFKNLLFKEEEGVGYLVVNRPKALNALNYEVLAELGEAADLVAKSETIRALIITGSGEKAFVAGADIKEMKDKTSLEGQSFSRFGNEVFSKIAKLPQPTIAVVNGFALGGGCELALSCDIRIGTKKTKIGQPEVGLGIIPGFGGTQRLARLIGPGRAKDLIFTARTVDGEEAFQMGILNKIFDEETLNEDALNYVKLILKQAPLAVERAKDAIDNGLLLPIDQGLLYEAELFGSLFSTEDQTEGMEAFVNKRSAEFKRQ